MSSRRSALHLSTLGAVALTTLLSARAQAHVSLSEPKSRYWNATTQVADQQKQKVGPCGVSGDARSATPSLISTFRPGQRVTVRWTETVQHPGHYRIAFDSDGQDFPVPGTTGMPAGVTILADNIADKGGGGGVAYTQEVTLPAEECTRCTLQLIQVMTTAAPPYQADDLYFNCADVILSNGSGGAGGGSGGAGGSAGSSMGGSATSGSGGAATSGNGGASAGSSGRGGATSAGASGGGSAGAVQGGSAGAVQGGSASGGQSGGGSSGLGGSAGQSTTNGGSGGTPAAAGTSAGGSPAAGAPSAGAPNTAGGTPSTPPDPGGDTSSGCALGGASPEGGLGASLLALGAVWLARRRRQRAV